MNELKSTHILSYLDVVTKEREHLQRGMNFRSDGRPSVFLMSVKPNAPYQDEWHPDGQILIYEGHDEYGAGIRKKEIDQPMYSKTGNLTDNGKFFYEANKFLNGEIEVAHKIQVYEKLAPGIWYDKGIFELIDAKIISRHNRKVFTFHLHPLLTQISLPTQKVRDYKHERMIPSAVKVAVWKRDKGQCTTCGATTGLHYDHILPFAKGGRSDDDRNIQLLCARHNLEKSDKIM